MPGVVEQLQEVARAAPEVGVRVEDVGDEDLPAVGGRLGGRGVEEVGKDLGFRGGRVERGEPHGPGDGTDKPKRKKRAWAREKRP